LRSNATTREILACLAPLLLIEQLRPVPLRGEGVRLPQRIVGVRLAITRLLVGDLHPYPRGNPADGFREAHSQVLHGEGKEVAPLAAHETFEDVPRRIDREVRAFPPVEWTGPAEGAA